MARVTCSRCFRVFEDGAPGAAPLCPACAGPDRSPAGEGAGPAADPGRAPARFLPRAPLAAGLASLVALGAAICAVARLRAPVERARLAEPSAVELEVGAWKAEGRVRAQGHPERHLEAARRALRADLPERTAEARREYMAALALSPADVEALAGYVTAFSWAAGAEPDPAELAACHRMMRWALPRAGGRADLLAAEAHLLLLSPGPSNAADAAAAARLAQEAAPDSAPALLALGRVALPGDPRAAAAWLERAAAEWPEERRALTLAARARWAAGDAPGALGLLSRRLRLDPGQPEALALLADVQAASGRFDAARRALRLWAEGSPGAAGPSFQLGRIALQVDGDPAAARRLLRAALALRPDDLLAARILADVAAAERVSADLPAAHRALDEALRRVPGSAEARFQAAQLAWRERDFFGLRQAAGVLGGRAGERAARTLESRVAELDGRGEDAIAAAQAAAATTPRDLAAQLAAAGSLLRLGAPEPALALARRAAALDPADPRARRALERFWEGPAPLAEAARRFLELADRDPRAEALAASAAAASELVLGRPRSAEGLARRGAAADPELAWPREILAQAMLDLGRPRDAVREADAAIAAEAAAVPWEIRARALEALGRDREALEAHRRALRASPGLATARLGEALALRRLGDPARSRQLLSRLLEDDPGCTLARGALLAP